MTEARIGGLADSVALSDAAAAQVVVDAATQQPAATRPVSARPGDMILSADVGAGAPSAIGGIAAGVTFTDGLGLRAAPQLLNGTIYFADKAAWVPGGTLTVSGLTSYDHVSILPQGDGTGQVGVSGQTLRYGGVDIGTISGGDGANLTIAFNGAASADAVTAVTQRLGYQLGQGGIIAEHNIHIGLVDGNGLAVNNANQYTSIVGKDYANISFAGLFTPYLYHATVGDLNHDGHIDVVMSGDPQPSAFRIFYEPGVDADFDAWYENVSQPDYFVDDNGVLYIRDQAEFKKPVQVYLNDGTDHFIAGSNFGDVDSRNVTTTLGDYNADGVPDIFVSARYQSDFAYVTEYTNDGSGRFQSGHSMAFFYDDLFHIIQPNVVYTSVGDLGRGSIDAIVSIPGMGIVIAPKGYDGGFIYGDLKDPFTQQDPFSWGKTYMVDADGDGDLDVILANGGTHLYLNDGHGNLTETANNPFASVISIGNDYSFADIDNDGDLDIFIGDGRIVWNNSSYGTKPNSLNGDITLSYNFPQTVNADAYATNEDNALVTSAQTGVLGNDLIPGTLSALLETGPTHGTLTLNADGSFTYTPNANYNGNDSFTYRVNDGTTTSAPVAVSLTINPVVDPIVAVADGAAVAANGSVTIHAFDNDSNTDLLTMAVSAINGVAVPAFSIITLPSGAQVEVRSDGQFLYHANGAFDALVSPETATHTGLASSATDTFTYTVGGSTATVTVNITGVDGAGDAVAPLAPTLSGLVDGLTFTDRADTLATAHVIDSSVTLTAPADFRSNGATLTVSGLNGADLVALASQGNGAGQIGVSGTVLSWGGIAIGTIAGGQGIPLTVTFNGAATIAAIDATIEALSYRLGTGAITDHALHLALTEAGADPRSVGHDLALTFAFPAPVGVADAYAVDRGDVLTVNAQNGVLANDAAAGASQAVLAAGPTHGALTLNADGSFSYTPDAGYAGADAFTYRIDDGGLTSTPVTVALTVNGVTVPTLLLPDIATITEHGTASIAVLANDLANDGPALAVASIAGVAAVVGVPITLASGATVTLLANGEISYDPNGGFDWLVSPETGAATGAMSSATDSFSYAVGGGLSETVTVTITGMAGAGDQLHGSAAADVIAGLAGVANYFDLSQGGADSATGSTLNDAFFMGGALDAGDHIDGGGGSNDQIALQGDYTGGNALVLGANTISGIEVITGLAGFSYDITSNDGNVATGETLKIYASTLGAGDSFTFNGSAETDGKFMMYGGLGADHFTGGAGDDGFYFGRDGRFNVATDHVDGGAGNNDQLALEGDYNVTISNAVLTNVEVISLLDGLATHSQYHITLSDDWTAAGQTHTVYSVPVRDGFIVDASAETDGNIKVYGGLGSDTITTGAGNDWIMGGAGADMLNGGLGADTFVYTKVSHSIGSSHDIIIGFDPTVDKIDLPTTVTGIDAAITTGSLSTGSFDADLTAALAGLNANHAITFTADSGTLSGHIFEVIDTNGIAGYQAGQDMVIELQTPAGAITDTTPFV
ncbi:MAG TPA: Ig-like domain-containing protein [Sphingomonas sp.]|nr:Ig-like domain-containing protein [Sphingomonas sp.]